MITHFVKEFTMKQDILIYLSSLQYWNAIKAYLGVCNGRAWHKPTPIQGLIQKEYA